MHVASETPRARRMATVSKICGHVGQGEQYEQCIMQSRALAALSERTHLDRRVGWHADPLMALVDFGVLLSVCNEPAQHRHGEVAVDNLRLVVEYTVALLQDCGLALRDVRKALGHVSARHSARDVKTDTMAENAYISATALANVTHILS